MQDNGRIITTAGGARNPFVKFAERVRSRRRRKAAATAIEPEDHLVFLQQLMADNVSLDRAYGKINQRRERKASAPNGARSAPNGAPPDQSRIVAVTLAPLAPAPDGDLLTRVIEGVRPLLADATQPTKARIRLLWAAAKHARKLGATDVVSNAFTALAVETNLIDRHGHWTGTDVRDYVRRHGAEDVAHEVAWALRGWNPFETGPPK